MEKTFTFIKIYRQMKKIFLGLTLVLGVSVLSANAQNVAPAANKTTAPAASAAIVFVEKDNTHDFGTIPQGTPATYNFTLKNTGKVPLVLSSVTPGCGCTSPEWPKEPIKPGASAVIKVTYNAQTPGTFNKPVTIVSNAATPQVVLYIKGEVKPTEQQATNSNAQPVQSAAPKKN
jgi:hypothetical protein